MMEEGLFLESKQIANSLKNDVVEARLHTDRDAGPELDRILQLQKTLAGSKALPTFVLIDVDSEEILAKAIGNKDEAQFLKFLNEGLNK